MTNPNKTQIVVILDRSGSMSSVLKDTIGGFNAFLAEQRKAPGAANISLIQFDNEYTPVYEDVPVASARDLDEQTYQPRGSTALLDAIGRTITSTGQKLAALPESERPGKVLVVIITDGHENCSREFSRGSVFEMITHQREKYNWDFAFIGANQDAIAVASTMGIAAGAALNYSATGAGTQKAFGALAGATTNYRSGAVRGHNLFDPNAANAPIVVPTTPPTGAVRSAPKVTVK